MGRSLQQMLGKHILASLTEVDRYGRIVCRREFHGTLVELHGKPALQHAEAKRPFALPEELDYYHPVDPQRCYTLEASGEVICGIDYALTFIKGPPEFMQQGEQPPA